MKLKLLIISAGLIFSISSYAQNGPSIPERIANRMKDSLQLNDAQKGQVLSINQLIFTQKAGFRSKYNGTDSLPIYMQRAEISRDSLYKPILTTAQYSLYMEKRPNLINAN